MNPFTKYKKEKDFKDAEGVDGKDGDKPPFSARARGAPQRHALPDERPYKKENKKYRADDAERAAGKWRGELRGEILEV